MATLRDMPIKQKLMAIIMLVTTAALLVSSLGVVIADSYLYRSSMRRDLSALGQIVADNSTAALTFDDPRIATDTLASLQARVHLAAACLYRPETVLFAKFERSGSGFACPNGRGPDGLRFTTSALTLRRPVMLNGDRIGTLILVYDLGEFAQRLRIYGQSVLIVFLISAIFALLLSSRLRTIIAGPISELAGAARSVSETRDYSIRVRKDSADELGALAEKFNEMLARIQSQDDDLRKALLAREAALLETEQVRDSLRTTLASIGDGVISTDAEGRIVFINHTASEMLGLSESQVVGRHLDEVFRIFNEFTREPVESPVAKVLREGRIVGLANHSVLMAADGSEIPIDDSGAPLRNSAGVIQGTVLVFRNVGARRKAEETSRLLVSIVESSDDAIFSRDLDGIVTSWNAGAERMFGFSAQEMIGRHASAIVPEDRMEEAFFFLDKTRRGQRVQRFETVRCSKSGKLLNVSLSISPMQDQDGRITGASTIARDISEQVRSAESRNRLNDDLRRSNEALALTNQDLERFAFIASHDLQEPLRMITAYSQLLIKSYPGEFDDNGKTFVANIVDGTKRMRELLTDLLAYTAIRATDEGPRELVDLNAVIDDVRSNLQASIDETGAAVTCDLLPVISAYRGHFQPLFQNLIGNAIKYRSEQAPRIHVSVRQKDGELQFSVADNGIGIDGQYHRQIFEVFKRLHGKKIPGTGVGLAICQRVVERYGGRIWVESELGKGSTFWFTLTEVAARFVRGGA